MSNHNKPCIEHSPFAKLNVPFLFRSSRYLHKVKTIFHIYFTDENREAKQNLSETLALSVISIPY